MNKSLLKDLRDYLLKNLGLHFTESREKELFSKIKLAAAEFNFIDTGEFIVWLLKTDLKNAEIEKLAAFITIGETYFMREIKALDYFEKVYLPQLINKRKKEGKYLRIWSAGCSSGEEPYSVATIVKRLIPDIKNWDISILGTDINANILKKARAGVYSKWSFRGTPESFRNQYFKEIDENKYKINDDIKSMVKISYLNLAKDSYPSITNNTNAMDLILCRNVLIYFSNEGIKEVTSNIHNSLIDDGILLVSPVEASHLLSDKFRSIQYEGISIYQKSSLPNENKRTLNAGISKISIKQENNYYTKPKVKLPIPPKKETKRAKELIPSNYHTKKANQNKMRASEEFQKAISLYNSGLYDESEVLLLSLMDSQKVECSLLFLLLARIKANKGLLDESENYCLQALNIDKLNPETHFLLANIYEEQGKDDDAKRTMMKTIFLDPDFAMAHYALANLHIRNNNPAESKKYFRNATNSLSKYKADETLGETDGMTAGRLLEIINAVNP